MRHCSKPGCEQPAVATLTYDYRASTAVLGPLSTMAEPHAYDLCTNHAQGLTVPRGWQVIRLQTDFEPAPPSDDELLAIVEAVKEVAGIDDSQTEASRQRSRNQGNRLRRNQWVEQDHSAAYAPRRKGGFQVITGGEAAEL